jgi:hypothetical protein
MLSHVELNRTFWSLADAEDHEPDTLRTVSLWGMEGIAWPELLESARVVILAEAGTGKTHELRQTARKLRAEGKAAFLCNIADLAETSRLEGALIEGRIEDFDRWIATDEPAWFMLDSVDEARLAGPRVFGRALRALAGALNSEAKRARIFITSRVSDWRATQDLTLLRDILPPPRPGI